MSIFTSSRSRPPIHRRLPVAVATAAVVLAFVALAAPALAAPTRSPVWTKYYQGSPTSNDVYIDVAVNPAGGAYCVGRTSLPGGHSADMVLAKYGARGELKWRRFFDNPTHHSSDEADAVVLDQRGNVFVFGHSERPTYLNDAVLLKYTSAGRLLWRRSYVGGVAADQYPVDLRAMNNAGNAFALCEQSVASVRTALVLKYSPGGRRLWVAGYAGAGVDASAGGIALDAAGGVYVCGYVNVPGTGWETYTLKYAPASGHRRWLRRVPGATGADSNYPGLAVRSGFVWTVGATTGSTAATDLLLLRYRAGDGAARGSLRWNDSATGPAKGRRLVLDGSGHAYVVGDGFADAAGSQGMLTMRVRVGLGANLLPEWSRYEIDGDTGFGSRVVLDGRGHVVVLGMAQTSTPSLVAIVCSYSVNGSLAWKSEMLDGVYYSDLARTAAGSIYTCGGSGTPPVTRALVAKYAR